MITITIDSLPVCLDLLKSINFNDNLVLLNDGLQSRQILAFNARSENFEANGMYQTIEVEYQISLAGEQLISFQVKQGKVKVIHLPASLEKNRELDRMPSQVSEYYLELNSNLHT